MDPERWHQVERFYQAALERDPDERATFLVEACREDNELRREVESLLAQHASLEGTPDRRAADLVSDSPATHLAPGLQLGPYRIEKMVGEGGMGTVYRALDTKLNRPVAIKLLSDDLTDATARHRFQREAQMASSLNHPHILTVHDVGEFEGRQYLVTEFVDGGTLKDWAKAEKRTWRQTVELLTDVADGLGAAHVAGVTHRDIKPANILVAKNGYAKLADFGLAKLTNLTSEGATRTLSVERTRPGLIVGTIAYMSPEQASGRTLDARSDIFSFGVVLYEMLAGRRPFAGATDLEELQAIIHGSAQQLGENVPATLRAMVEKALEKDPAHRYQSMQELVVDLRRLIRQPTEAPARAVERMASIAVLPFADMSVTKDQDWFCDGIAEEILNALASLQGLRVAARTSAFSFKGKSDDLRTIGEKLNVTTVLEGSVRRVGDRVRITAQLSNVQNGYQLWSERYDRELKDIFDVQDEIAKAIAERLRVTLAGPTGDRLVEQATVNIEAYQLYLKGRALLTRRGAGMKPASEYFHRAVELDPRYAQAWAGIAEALTWLAITGFSRGSEARLQAITAATRSIELDSGSASGHTALACATLVFENNHLRAKQEFERALELNPSYALGRCWYAQFYLQWARGDYESGVTESRRALDIDPLSAYATMIFALCLCTAGRLDEAIEAARRSVQLDSESFVARWALGVCLGMASQFEEAVATLEAAVRMSGRQSIGFTSLTGTFGRWGKRSEACALHSELKDRALGDYVPAAHLALTADAAGQRDEAIQFARRAWEQREPPFILWARHFPEFGALRSDPRFGAILRDMDSA